MIIISLLGYLLFLSFYFIKGFSGKIVTVNVYVYIILLELDVRLKYIYI